MLYELMKDKADEELVQLHVVQNAVYVKNVRI